MDKEMLVDFLEENFTKIGNDKPHPTQCSVMPVVAIRGDEIRPLGTCFAITNNGLVLTAKHVVEEAIKFNEFEKDTGKKWWVGVLYISDQQPETDNNTIIGGIFTVNKVFQNSSDVAAMHVNIPIDTTTNKTVFMPLHILSPGIPKEGGLCVGIGYHKMDCSKISNINHISQSYAASKGKIEEIYLPKRDSHAHNFPCLQCSTRFDGGMSGGPVIGDNGNVIGVVCSTLGNPDGLGYISHVSLICNSLFLQIEYKDDDGLIKKNFLYDFFIGGSLLLDDTINELVVERYDNTLSINFELEDNIKGNIKGNIKSIIK